ncbi:dihydrolipoamide acetyltransferase family protein [Geomicrobium sediminis]|uniref:Dihydrolipoamide acetyltransferase component of pyruvate dehydrogenase complex n=1 Tax=Geomicrobium sediminis TaxID=1347788 RepID=A0ABS2P8G4_9BACL|nr:dihydrolipoamide acetyltransferase family protein [Geomicrobium sediminis]MBM7631702.1 pyruvate dehydrogenase E2 component (dihydrolipoamide acetyltransferase) [Geomicrobium sediminis]
MFEMKLTDLGEGIHEGTVDTLYVGIGDVVSVDQPVIAVQTDKVTADLPSPVAGTIKDIVVSEGDVVSLGEVMVKISNKIQEKETLTTKTIEKATPENQTELPATRLFRLQNVKAAPFTRKLARTYGVAIETVTGTGKNNRITIEDIRRHIEQPTRPEDEVAATTAIEETTVRKSTPARTSIPYKGRRKQIGAKMTQSVKAIPHVTHFERIDVTELLSLKESYSHQSGASLSLSAVFIKAIAISLHDFPIFNSKLDAERGEIVFQDTVNIGMATHAEEGLIVPVVKDVDALSIQEIHNQFKQLTKKAQTNTCELKDLQGGTFTMSNVGPIGGVYATPIINYPETGILSFHKIEDTPVVRDKEIVIRSLLNVSFSFDHRVADGFHAVSFTNRVKELLEQPMHLLVALK